MISCFYTTSSVNGLDNLFFLFKWQSSWLANGLITMVINTNGQWLAVVFSCMEKEEGGTYDQIHC